MQNIYVLVLSGGTGTRFASSVPKQFANLKGESLLVHSVKKFLEWGFSKEIIVVAHENYLQKTERELSQILRYYDKIVAGGETRHKSFLNGLKSIQYGANDIIVIHDAARPFFTSSEISTLVRYAEQYGSASLAEKTSETLVESENNLVKNILNREIIYSIKTPQAIHTSLLEELLKILPSKEPTDLCSWVAEVNQKSYLVESNPFNFKITYESDLEKAEVLYEVFKQYESKPKDDSLLFLKQSFLS